MEKQQERQTGVIPWRRSEGGEVEILLITSRTTGQWCVPKGWIEPHLSPSESAAQEGREEAGVAGEVADKPAGAYEYSKRGLTFIVDLYPMRVTEELAEWPEADQRLRRWARRGEVEQLVADEGLRAAILNFINNQTTP